MKECKALDWRRFFVWFGVFCLITAVFLVLSFADQKNAWRNMFLAFPVAGTLVKVASAEGGLAICMAIALQAVMYSFLLAVTGPWRGWARGLLVLVHLSAMCLFWDIRFGPQ